MLKIIIEYLPKIIDFIMRLISNGYNVPINDFAEKNKSGNDSKRYIQNDEIGFRLKYTKWDNQRDSPYNKLFPRDRPENVCFLTSIAANVRTQEQPVYGGLGRRKYLREDSEDILLEYLQKNRAEHTKILQKIIGKSDYLPRYVYKFWEWFINEKIPGFSAQHKVFTRIGLNTFIQRFKIPVTIGTKLTEAHVVNAIGGTEKGLWCNDSYGDRNYGYKKKDGKEVFYTWDLLRKKNFNSIVITHDKGA
jgi:hypothetical protein